MSTQPQTFVFFGIVGSGKGTQVKFLMDFLNKSDGRECVYAYPGDEYRKIIQSGSFTGNLMKDSISRGELQPGFFSDATVEQFIDAENISNDVGTNTLSLQYIQNQIDQPYRPGLNRHIWY